MNENSEAIPGFDPGDLIPMYHHIPKHIAMQKIEYPQLIKNIKINLMQNYNGQRMIMRFVLINDICQYLLVCDIVLQSNY